MSKEKTHYRKAFNSPYLSAADIVEPVTFTVSHVTLGKDETKKSKDSFNTAHFVEREIRTGEILKPMVLNVQNSRMLKEFSGSPYIEDWKNIPITIFVDKNVKFGRDIVEGLRISKERPRLTLPAFDTVNDMDNAIIAYRRDKDFSKIEERRVLSNRDKESIRSLSKEDGAE